MAPTVVAESAGASIAPAGMDCSPPEIAAAPTACFRVRLLVRFVREVAAAAVEEEAPPLALFLTEVLLLLVAVALGFAALPPLALLEAFLVVFETVVVVTGLIGLSSRSTSTPRLALGRRRVSRWARDCALVGRIVYSDDQVLTVWIRQKCRFLWRITLS